MYQTHCSIPYTEGPFSHQNDPLLASYQTSTRFGTVMSGFRVLATHILGVAFLSNTFPVNRKRVWSQRHSLGSTDHQFKSTKQIVQSLSLVPTIKARTLQGSLGHLVCVASAYIIDRPLWQRFTRIITQQHRQHMIIPSNQTITTSSWSLLQQLCFSSSPIAHFIVRQFIATLEMMNLLPWNQ